MTLAVLGAPITIRYELDLNGGPEDPATLRLRVRRFGGADLEIAEWAGSDGDIIKDSTGRFHADVLPAEVGRYVYRWEARDDEDEQIGADEGEFEVHTRYR